MADPVPQTCACPDTYPGKQHGDCSDIQLLCVVDNEQLILQHAQCDREQGKGHGIKQYGAKCLHDLRDTNSRDSVGLLR